MRSFLEEARLLAHIRHPNVVEVQNFIKANETAYMVMRYEHGHSLHEYVRALQRKGVAIKEDFLRNVFVHLLAGLREVHTRKLLHLDLKPANIYLRDDRHPVLLDFGATRLGLGQRDPTLGHMFTPGFAAPELQGSGEALRPLDRHLFHRRHALRLPLRPAPQVADLARRPTHSNPPSGAGRAATRCNCSK
jgi:hypothetical protein